MSSMTDGTPERVPGAASWAAVEQEVWPRVETDLAAVDARVRTLVAGDRVDELATRRARRARRRALHAARHTGFRGGDAA